MKIIKKIWHNLNYGLKELWNSSKNFKGFDRVKAIFDMLWCWLRYGASPNNYIWFDFFNATSKQRKTYMTHKQNVHIIKLFNNPNSIYKVQNKFTFAEILGEKYGRFYALSNQVDFAKFKKIASSGKIVYKPLRGAQGAGISVFESNNIDALYEYVTQLPLGIIEQWINQNDEMSSLYPNAVNPLRIQTLYIKDTVHIIAGTITIANGTKIANASAPNSIFALIDVNTGIVCTDGCDYSGNYFIQHPETKKTFKGFQIPYWDKVVDLINKTAKRFPDIRHIGWDVAIGKDGPIIIEANETPGYTAFQTYKLTKKHEGLMPIYKKLIIQG